MDLRQTNREIADSDHFHHSVDFFFQLPHGLQIPFPSAEQRGEAGWLAHALEGVELQYLSLFDLVDAGIHVAVQQRLQHLAGCAAVLIQEIALGGYGLLPASDRGASGS